MGQSFDDGDREVEALLEHARPAPGLTFAADLERSLFPAPARSRLRDRRFVAGLSFASALAAVFVVVSLVGGGPLASHGGDAAKAGQRCRTVYVTKSEPLGQVVRRTDGTVTVETAKKPVTRAVERCR